jgi:hypothetical protein
MKARIFLAASFAVLLSTSGCVSAENEARFYVVVSLVGDQINVVNYQPTTGSSLDHNLHKSILVKDTVFDRDVLLAADEALKRHDAGARVRLLVSSTPGLFEHQDRFFDGSRVALPKEIDSAARAGGATHLLLVTKYRAEAAVQFTNEKAGSGKLEGLGFYVDQVKETIRTDTGEVGRGFLAGFVYIKVALVDLNTSIVVREQPITATAALSAANSKAGGDPWDALSPAEKLDMLHGMIKQELARVVPQIIARP